MTFLDGRLRQIGGQERGSTSWVKMVALAEDCQSCNVLLVLDEKGVVLKTIRRIAPGEEMLMWFTENILAMMSMPFLTPANIQGIYYSATSDRSSTDSMILCSLSNFGHLFV